MKINLLSTCATLGSICLITSAIIGAKTNNGTIEYGPYEFSAPLQASPITFNIPGAPVGTDRVQLEFEIDVSGTGEFNMNPSCPDGSLALEPFMIINIPLADAQFYEYRYDVDSETRAYIGSVGSKSSGSANAHTTFITDLTTDINQWINPSGDVEFVIVAAAANLGLFACSGTIHSIAHENIGKLTVRYFDDNTTAQAYNPSVNLSNNREQINQSIKSINDKLNEYGYIMTAGEINSH